MIRLIVVALICAGLICSPRSAASSTISMVVGNEALGSCELGSDNGPLVTLSVIHWPSTTATGARYRISACSSTLVWIADYSSFNITGDFTSGYVIDYGACLGYPIVAQTLLFIGTANSAVKVMPHPESASGLVEGIGCNGEVEYPEPGGICIKGTQDVCWCNYLGPPYHHIPCTEPVPVQASTWGSVKALYR
jgi:hypothetical protein